MINKKRVLTALVAVTAAAGGAGGLAVVAPSAGAAPVTRPTVSALSISAGPTAGGPTITVRGSGFTHVSKVLFGTTAGAGVDVRSGTKLTVRTPKHVAGRVNVRVVVSYKGATTESARTGADLFTFDGPPAAVTLPTSTSTGSSITLRWNDPASAGFTGVMIRRETSPATALTRPTAGTLVADLGRAATTYTVTSLTAGAKYSYALFAHDAYGHYSAAAPLTALTLTKAEAARAWSGPTQPFDAQGTPDAVSCPSTTYCAAVANNGVVFTYDGSVWSPTSQLPGGSHTLECPSTTFCLASADNRDVYRYNGTAWTATTLGSPAGGGPFARDDAIETVTCASTQFCVAGSILGNIFTYDGKTWSDADNVFPELDAEDVDSVTSLSCPTSTFCAATDAFGEVATYDGSKWNGFYGLGGFTDPVTSVSCTSATYCLATIPNGPSADEPTSTVNRFDGSAWTGLGTVPAGLVPISVTCHSTAFCLVLGSGNSAVYDGSYWSSIDSDDVNEGQSVSCPSATFCVGPTSYGVDVRTAAGWSPTAFEGSGLNQIACAAGPFCLGVDDAGNVDTYRSGSWRPTKSVGLHEHIYQLSCASATLCVAGTDDGARVFNGTTWSNPAGAGNATLEYVSCPAHTSFCLASNTQGDTYTYDGTSWTKSAQTAVGPLDVLSGLSCAAPSTCVGVYSTGDFAPGSRSYAITYAGGRWHQPHLIGAGNIARVTCSSVTFCLATGLDNNSVYHVFTYDGSHWSTPHNLGMEIRSESCASSTFCVVVGNSLASIFDGTTWSTPAPVSAQATALDPVSCTTDDFCLADDNQTSAYTLY